MDMKKVLGFMISDIPIFNELDEDDVEILQQYLFPKDLEKQGLVCKEGQHGSFLSFVANGVLEVIKTLDGKEVTIATL